MLGKDAIDIRVQLVVPKDKKGSGGGPAGTVVLRLAYNEIVSEAQMLETQAENDGDLVAGMLMCERKRVKYSFKASSNKQSRAWLAALRWLAEDFVRCVSPRLTIVSQLGPAPLLQSKYSTPTLLNRWPFWLHVALEPSALDSTRITTATRHFMDVSIAHSMFQSFCTCTLKCWD